MMRNGFHWHSTARAATLALLIWSGFGAQVSAPKRNVQFVVPRIFRYAGTLPAGSTADGDVGVMFSIYRDQYDGAPIWSEVQNVRPDSKGGYSALLGSTRNEGLPIEVFQTSEPRWLEVEVNGVKEPRVLIGSVPYAMVAGNAETLGGLPASAYLRAPTSGTAAETTGTAGVKTPITAATPLVNAVMQGYLATFIDNSGGLGDSAAFQGTFNSNPSLSIGGTTQLGALTLIGNVPGGDTAGIALYNQGGGAGASVSPDMYNTFANGGIPQAKIKALDDGNYSDHLTFWTKTPGGQGNPVAERVRITSTGNVGIGTGSPGAKLEVAGSVKISGAGSALVFPDGTSLATAAGAGGGATVTVGTTTTGAAGTNASVTNSGTSTAAVLNFTIPQGAQGPVGATGATGPQGPAGNSFNLAAVAQLRWGYSGMNAYTLGTSPYGVAFDGTNIWVTNQGSNNVTKVAASTGATVGTYAVGRNPYGVAFDGGNVWVANSGSNNVTRIASATGAVLGTYAAGTNPQAIAFDGTNFWVANQGSGNVTKILASSGATVGTYATGNSPNGVAFDGTNIWVTNGGPGTVTKLLASTGAIVGTYGVGYNPQGVAFDGTNIWVACTGSVTKLLASTGAIAATYNNFYAPYGIAFDGSNMWVADASTGTVTKISPSAQ